jgi:hypothetical protein
VARYALSLELGQREVARVVETDVAVRLFRLEREYATDVVLGLVVAALAVGRLGQAVRAIGAGRRVAAVAAEARGLSLTTAGNIDEMRAVREACGAGARASREHGGPQRRDDEHDDERSVAHAHGPPRVVKSKS